MRVSALLIAAAFSPAAKAEILVLAPSSMTEVATALAEGFGAVSGISTKVSVAATGQLARQLEAGVPADVFITADRDWLDWTLGKGVVKPESVRTIAANQLVVAVRRETENWADIEAILTGGYFAMGDPAFVPAGAYAERALRSKGIWERAKKHAVYGENVRFALQRLQQGEVEAAIVYKSDLNAFGDLREAFSFSEAQSGPIAYFAALTNHADEEGATFITFLSSSKGLEIFLQYGFTQAGEPRRH